MNRRKDWGSQAPSELSERGVHLPVLQGFALLPSFYCPVTSIIVHLYQASFPEFSFSHKPEWLFATTPSCRRWFLFCSTGALPVKEPASKVEGPLTHTALTLTSSRCSSPSKLYCLNLKLNPIKNKPVGRVSTWHVKGRLLLYHLLSRSSGLSNKKSV